MSALGAQKAHLDTEVLGLVALIDEEVVYLADLAASGVIDLVGGEAVLYLHEPIGSGFSLHACTSLLTYRCHALLACIINNHTHESN
jgi:hypothetical protein